MSRFQTNALIMGAEIPMSAVDMDLRYSIWNTASERLSGVPAAKVLGERMVDVFPWMSTKVIDAIGVTLGTGKETNTRAVYHWPACHGIGVVERRPIRGLNGEVEGALLKMMSMRKWMVRRGLATAAALALGLLCLWNAHQCSGCDDVLDMESEIDHNIVVEGML